MKTEYIIFIVLLVILGAHLLLNKSKSNKGLMTGKVDLGNFPRPQISRHSLQLSNNIPVNPLYNRKEGKIDESKVNIIRSSNVDNDKNPIYYKPSFYKKDFISPNPLGSTEYNFAEFNDKKTSYAWTENNVSQHPQFYRSNIKDEKTNVGRFFSKNKFHDKTSPYSTNNLPDRCFLDKDDEIVCNFNDRLQNIPPSLIEGKNKVLNSVGVIGSDNSIYKDIHSKEIDSSNGNSYVAYEYSNEKEMNGADVYKGVQGSFNNNNEQYLDLNSLEYKKNYAI